MRLIIVEHIGPVPAPRVGLAGSEAFHAPDAIDFKVAQVPDQDPGVPSFVQLPNDQNNPFAPTFIPVEPKRHDCGKKKNIVMAKIDDFSRFFRKLFGFGPIEESNLLFNMRIHPTERHDHRTHPGPKMMAAHAESDEDDAKFHILPFMPGPVRGEGFPPPGSDDVSAHFDTTPSHLPTGHPGTSDERRHLHFIEADHVACCGDADVLCTDPVALPITASIFRRRRSPHVPSKFGDLVLKPPPSA